ncbi:MAG TPA: vWA domain-containing protein [Pyrinomonadaceae bacterium]|nr:vWA domain-containing protein [Pyrinomonadaceae bacterium]
MSNYLYGLFRLPLLLYAGWGIWLGWVISLFKWRAKIHRFKPENRESIIILMDVSASTLPFRSRLANAAESDFESYLYRVTPNSTVTFFDQKIVHEIPLHGIVNLSDALKELSGGQTNIAGALEFAITKLSTMPRPGTILLYTDGQDSFDVESVSDRMKQEGLSITVKEANNSNQETPLYKLAQLIGGQYYRI